MNIPIKVSLVLTGVLSLCFSAQAELTANIGVYSDYLFRGVTQTQEDPAVQGGVDWASDTNGFYAGTWLSNTDFNPPEQEDSGIEIDLYAGYTWEQGRFSFDLGIISYQYPSISSNTEEAYIGLGVAGFEAYLWHNWDNENTFYSAAYGWTVAEDMDLSLGAGFFDPDQGQDYLTYSVTVSKPFNDFEWSLVLSNTDIDGDNFTAVLGVSTEFGL